MRAVVIQLKGHNVFQEQTFVMSCRFTLLPPSVLPALKEKKGKTVLSNRQGAQWRQTGFDKVYPWQCVWPVNCSGFYTHVPTQTPTQICTCTLPSIPVDIGVEKTCRHGRLSKQLQQIETKLNLKPRAKLATERLWQIWQGRKGSAAGPKVGAVM